MDFFRIGDYLATSSITGPRHNLLQLRISSGEQAPPTLECLPPAGACKHDKLDEAQIVARVLEGVAEANRDLGCSFAVTHIRYVENDTKPEIAYAVLAYRIVERLESGGDFKVSAITK